MLISEFVREPKGIVTALMAHGKGLLAADESRATITSRFKPFAIEPTVENQRLYRQLLFTTGGRSWKSLRNEASSRESRSTEAQHHSRDRQTSESQRDLTV